ncbi:MAG: outer membrane beta-barrel protein [Prevotella sp.]|nr:outer membrane beta-barrel protein [Prevotella sp.]
MESSIRLSSIVIYRIVFAVIFAILSLAQATAKDYNHPVQGVVFDSFSEDGLPALVTLMTADSVVIDTMTARVGEYLFSAYPRAADYQFTIQKVGRYIVKAEMKGYIDAYVNFELRSNREQFIRVKPLRMMKAYHDLPEVSVKATKIKMVMRGDTIVYNADAFNLAEGSMLDALVRRLPGVRLTREGEIFVNGKKIESLLVNGRDFFSGSPQVALQNLPAYTVSKIKVYDEAGAASRIMQRDMGDKRYVMDVNLKKEYAKTYIGNAEAGYGTENRYLAKAFGIKMSDKEWVMGSASINNLSDYQQVQFDQSVAGGEWAWKSPTTFDGQITFREANFGYNRIFDRQNWLGGGVTLNHTDGDNESRTNTQTYLPEGDSFQQQQSHSTSKSTSLKGSLNHHFEKGVAFNWSDFSLQYIRNKNLSHSTQTTSDSASVLNEMLTRGSYENQRIFADGSISGGAKIIADMLRWSFSANYDRFTADRFSLNDIQYTNGQTPRDFRNTYGDNSHQQWNIKANTKYEICWPDKKITPEYEYNYKYNKTSNMLYRLDRLADCDSTIWDMLPSAREALIDVLDRPNSYDFHEYQNHHRFKVAVTSGKEYSNDEKKGFVTFWRLTLPLHIAHQNLYYNRLGRHDVSRRATFFEPELKVEGNLAGINWEFNGGISSSIPDMTMLVNYRDDTNPLNIRLGNPDLRNQHNYSASLYLRRWISSHQQSYWMNIGYNQQDNAVAYATEFDKTTGISTVRPVSVNGNWSTNATLGFSRALGKTDKFTINNQLRYNYNHNVDMAMVSGMAESQRSIVNNHQFSGNVKLNYRPNDNYEFTLHGGGTYYLVSSRREGFDPIHAGDYQVGFNTTLNLPAKFQFTTDLTMEASRGYQHEEMNKTDWIWNAQLTRSFLKGSLIAKLKGYDILQQIENTRYRMNAQGRTESWHNGIPRYVMLSLSWRFNVVPKGKN